MAKKPVTSAVAATPAVFHLPGNCWSTLGGYARLYDGTVAADYYQAMAMVERRLSLSEDEDAPPPSYGEMLALVDSLREGTPNGT